jgi:dephospho-CoA kinase
MTPKIIGLLGRSRVGKDTVADYIQKIYPRYEILRLSYPLKRASCALYGYTMEQLETNEKERMDPRWKKTPRECIQSLTDYMMKYMGVDFFTKRLYQYYESGKCSEYIIIPDIRYEHDIQEIRERGGVVFKIEKKNSPVLHAFEDHIDSLKGDYTLTNDSTKKELYVQIDRVIDECY